MDEQQAQKLYGEFLELQQQAENLSEHLKGMQEQLAQIEQTQTTVRELQQTAAQTPSWIPIAPGAYIKATTQPVDTVLLNVGAGIAVEKKPEAVLETLSEHKKVLEELMDAALEEFKQTAEKIEQIRSLVEKAQTTSENHAHKH